MKQENSNYLVVETDFNEITPNDSIFSKSKPDHQSPRLSTFYVVHSPTESPHSLEDNEEKTNDLNPPQSPLDSPDSYHSDSFRSRRSSFSRFFESWNNRRQGYSPRPSKYESHDNEEKGFLYSHDVDDHDSQHHGYFHCSYFFTFVVGFFLLFSIFSLILWISITFDKFYIQANGVDARGFITSTLSINSSVKLNFRNTGTFFRVHVTSTPLHLNYYQLPLATGNVPMFYQTKKSESSIEVMVKGNQIPLYGAGASLKTSNKRIGLPVEPVPLNLRVIVRSKAYVLGMLVTKKFYKKIECALIMESNKIGVPIPLANKCK
ncbi:hypothetical protein TSUD_121050 [Trifolium subterraneum]|uniref:Late embryogenesis abundant protein LEA-2 subgroup domain-containing protein n=1 Tax=Trifolium subterraneum TaxID=3900 RepID=A0A2Z6MDF6_TRISU|nr:hypothetical protein TSUD_121050 [Trifolium subterraneum]